MANKDIKYGHYDINFHYPNNKYISLYLSRPGFSFILALLGYYPSYATRHWEGFSLEFLGSGTRVWPGWRGSQRTWLNLAGRPELE